MNTNGSCLIFIVGSPRSGTKLLRDTINTNSSVDTSLYPSETPWKPVLKKQNHDELNEEQVSTNLKERARKFFDEKTHGENLYVEKNVRNSLRIPFLREIFPEARFIHIIRDPRDTIASIRKRWKIPIDLEYHLKNTLLKLTISEIIQLSWRLGSDLLSGILQGKLRSDSWGPRFKGIEKYLEDSPLIKVCSRQWSTCVESVLSSASKLSKDRYMECQYENLIRNPQHEIDRLASFLEIPSTSPMKSYADTHYMNSNIGNWKSRLTQKELTFIRKETKQLAQKKGYDLSDSNLRENSDA